MIKKIIFITFVIALVAGVFYYISFQRKLYRAILVEEARTNILEDFLQKTYPEQVKAYLESLKITQQANPTL